MLFEQLNDDDKSVSSEYLADAYKKERFEFTSSNESIKMNSVFINQHETLDKNYSIGNILNLFTMLIYMTYNF